MTSMTPTTTTHQLTLDEADPVALTVAERGHGRPVLLLHGGAGPQSVAEFADALSEAAHLRVITPVHPGFGGTPRPETLKSIADLAGLYLALLEELDLTDVTVIGNSVGGWIAAEIALLKSARVARMVLVDATGIQVPGHPVADVSPKTLPQIMQLSYHHAAPFLIDPAALPPAARQIGAANMAALAIYSGPHHGTDPTLLGRLSDVALATTVLWGESDHIVDVDYGRAYAAAIPRASFHVLPGTGHAPQVETPEQTITAVTHFLASTPAWEHDYTQNTTVSPTHVWTALRDIYTGSTSEGGDQIVLHGPFAVGSRLSITPQGADFVVDCVITELLEPQLYAYRSKFNGLYLTSRHTLTQLAAGGTRITHHSQIAGPRAEIAGLEIGPRITDDRTDTMNDLITRAAAHAQKVNG